MTQSGAAHCRQSGAAHWRSVDRRAEASAEACRAATGWGVPGRVHNRRGVCNWSSVDASLLGRGMKYSALLCVRLAIRSILQFRSERLQYRRPKLQYRRPKSLRLAYKPLCMFSTLTSVAAPHGCATRLCHTTVHTAVPHGEPSHRQVVLATATANGGGHFEVFAVCSLALMVCSDGHVCSWAFVKHPSRQCSKLPQSRSDATDCISIAFLRSGAGLCCVRAIAALQLGGWF